MSAKVHRSKWGTYHPAPECKCGEPKETLFPGAGYGKTYPAVYEHAADGTCAGAGPRWTIHDTRGYLDSGPSCDECGACECELCHKEGCGIERGSVPFPMCHHDDVDCIGLSFAFVCLDGGEALCEACARKAGVEIVECDCP